MATMQDRPIEFHLVLQVAQASLNLVHGWGGALPIIYLLCLFLDYGPRMLPWI